MEISINVLKRVVILFAAAITTSTAIAQVPSITSFSPKSGPIGTPVTISGTNFDSTPSNNIVYFGATQATVLTATVTQLTVSVPAGATYQPLSVLVGGLTAYAAAPFVITFSGGAIDRFKTKAKFVGDLPYGFAISDINNDGKSDVAIAESHTNSVSILKNNSLANLYSFSLDFVPVFGQSGRGIAIGDLDGDGNPDIAFANNDELGVSLLRNQTASGSVDFATKVDFLSAGRAYKIAIGDLDLDGKPDLAVATTDWDGGNPRIAVFKNTSSTGTFTTSSFAPAISFALSASPRALAIADVDADGKPDIIATTYRLAFDIGGIDVFKNTATVGVINSSSFSPKVSFSINGQPSAVAVGDLDGDGQPDLVTNGKDNNISILRNTTTAGVINSSSFAAKVDIATGKTAGDIALSDLDGDGKVDIAGVNFNNPNEATLSVFRNIATAGVITTGSFAARVDYELDDRGYAIAVGDLNGDGLPEIVVATEERGSAIYVLGKSDCVMAPSKPTITTADATTICEGSSIQLSAPDGFPAYVWSTGATDQQITVTDAGSYSVQVKDINGCASEASDAVTVTTLNCTAIAQRPIITSFSPKSGPIGTPVTITGTNFDATLSNNIVYFGATQATVLSATATQLTVSAPAGATYQPMSVLVGGLTTYSSLPFVITFSGGVIDENTFKTKTNFLPDLYSYSLAIGDINNDGKPDVATAEYQTNSVSISKNNGLANFFSFSSDFVSGPGGHSIAIGDLDGDGNPDVALAYASGKRISLLRNQTVSGSVDFSIPVHFENQDSPWSIIIEDLDLDGKPDLIFSTADVFGLNPQIIVLRNTGSTGTLTTSSFAAPTSLVASGGEVAFADVDADGKPDMIVTGGGVIDVFKNTATVGVLNSSSFAPKVSFSVGSVSYALTVGDLDGDGKPDLITATGDNISILRNTSSAGVINSSSFATKVDIANGSGTGDIALSDLDGDGKVDIATMNGDVTISVFRNTAIAGSITTSSFATKVDYESEFQAQAFALSDFNGDGRPEIAVANDGGSSTFFVLGNVSCLTAPPKPTITDANSATICEGSSIQLSAPDGFPAYVWSTGATDQQITVTDAGSYSVQVKDINGCTSAASDAVTVTTQNCATNKPPAISTTTVTTRIGGTATVDVSSLLSDPDNNLDLSTLKITMQPISGAVATLDNENQVITINYTGIPFSGIDRLRIEVCDVAESCVEEELQIEVIGDVVVFNAISPNGDGLNDIFRIQFIEIIPETQSNQVSIYNRWGDTVFEITDYNNGDRVFTGLSKNGKELPSGIYFYKIQFTSGKEMKTGYLSLKQ